MSEESWHGQVLESHARMGSGQRRQRGVLGGAWAGHGKDGAEEGWGQRRPEFGLLLRAREPQLLLLGVEGMRQSHAVG